MAKEIYIYILRPNTEFTGNQCTREAGPNSAELYASTKRFGKGAVLLGKPREFSGKFRSCKRLKRVQV